MASPSERALVWAWLLAVAVGSCASPGAANGPRESYAYEALEVLRPVHAALPALHASPAAALSVHHVHYRELPCRGAPPAPPGTFVATLAPSPECPCLDAPDPPPLGIEARVDRDGTTAVVSVPTAEPGTAYTVRLRATPHDALLCDPLVVLVGPEPARIRLRTPDIGLEAIVIRAEPVVLMEVAR